MFQARRRTNPPLVEKEFGFLIAILHAMFEN